VHAGRLRMSYGRAVQMEHAESLEACERGSIFVLFPEPVSTMMAEVGMERRHTMRRSDTEHARWIACISCKETFGLSTAVRN
jgi:hypothetical protein